MDPSQKSNVDAPRNVDREATPASRGPAVEVESKLKEAQANLMDAEGRLMASRAAAPSPPQAQPARTPEPPRVPASLSPSVPPTERLSENVAGMLSYLLGWITGIVFLLVDRRPFVRYHAAQSVAVFGALSILLLACGGFFLGALFPGAGHALLVLRRVLWLVWLVTEVVLMLKAAGGQRPHVGAAGRYADRVAHGAK